jgi:hypothetical protein
MHREVGMITVTYYESYRLLNVNFESYLLLCFLGYSTSPLLISVLGSHALLTTVEHNVVIAWIKGVRGDNTLLHNSIQQFLTVLQRFRKAMRNNRRYSVLDSLQYLNA